MQERASQAAVLSTCGGTHRASCAQYASVPRSTSRVPATGASSTREPGGGAGGGDDGDDKEAAGASDDASARAPPALISARGAPSRTAPDARSQRTSDAPAGTTGHSAKPEEEDIIERGMEDAEITL